MKKGMIFIDGSNVFYDWHAAKTGTQMDIEKYIDVVKSKFPDTDFVRTYYFTSASPTNTAFLHSVNRLPYCEVITGRLQEKKIKLDRFGISCPSCGTKITNTITTHVDKGTDVNIAVEMLRHGFNHTYDTAVLVSRDADFASVVKILKTLGINVELVVFDTAQKNAQELTDCVDNVVVLDVTDRKNCEQPTPPPSTTTSTAAPAAAPAAPAAPATASAASAAPAATAASISTTETTTP
ncbi:MAG: NYN domain-containing protein [Oscillospiraceae bacterium]|nr:NYN domain-containing protein [Oscillospiraceae bacterium]